MRASPQLEQGIPYAVARHEVTLPLLPIAEETGVS
jgi:hypothetical protein